MSQIRLQKTRELDEVLAFLKSRYRVLSEAEIIKLALAEKYAKEAKLPLVDEETEKLITQGFEDYKSGRFTELRTEEDIDKYFDNL